MFSEFNGKYEGKLQKLSITIVVGIDKRCYN